MNLESQVAPLAEALRMKELGFPQDTEFTWWRTLPDGKPQVEGPVGGYYESHEFEALCAAPTVAEMGEWMPRSIGEYGLEVTAWESGVWNLSYFDEKGNTLDHYGTGSSEAEARARLLIALAESGALDVKGLK